MFTRLNGIIPCGVCALLWIMGLMGIALPAHAQVFASVSGIARDQAGAALPEVTVTARNSETGLTRTATTDRGGRYAVVSLPVGQYDLTAAKSGFRSVMHSGITLAVAQDAVVDFALRLGEVRQRVTVSGEAPVVSATAAETSGLVGERQVKDLPLNGRSYDELMTLDPGVVNYTWEKTGGVGVSNSTVGNMFAVSGRRPQ
ncbi:MAG: carboxypeptidase-like regulatory domain-containing protein [Terriglobia bacterium]